MNPPPPPIYKDQRKIDADHLHLLAVFHFVGAGLALLGVLFLGAHFMLMRGIFSNPEMWKNAKGGPPPEQFFSMFKWIYLVLGIWFIASGVLNVISGLGIRARKHRTFSLVVAGVDCLYMPLGTVLGIFTIIVLNRDSVKEVFDAQPLHGG